MTVSQSHVESVWHTQVSEQATRSADMFARLADAQRREQSGTRERSQLLATAALQTVLTRWQRTRKLLLLRVEMRREGARVSPFAW